MSSSSFLRQVSRDAVRDQITEVALRLFMERGFEQTTVDDIASAVGMSQRTFFRYFTAKDEVVLSPYEKANAQMLTFLGQRPLDEDVWETLTAVCAHSMRLLYIDDQGSPRMRQLQQVIGESPALLASNLRQFDELQEQLTEAVVARETRRSCRQITQRVVARALVGASFAYLQAVISPTGTSGDLEWADRTFARLMDTMRPQGLDAVPRCKPTD